MIARPEWFAERGLIGKLRIIPKKIAGWLYYLGILIVIIVLRGLYSPLIILVIVFFVVDIICLFIKQRKHRDESTTLIE